MLETDLEILEKILRDLNYAPKYIEMLLSHLVKELDNSTLNSFTPQFIYSALSFEEGRNKAREIADYFQEFKEKGSYRTKLQKYLDSKNIQ